MSFIIGTAGHIDHGKTSLVRALTGQDTDRLKEEKERGISIDLGFAHLDLPDGTRVGVVDVPGHERFIKNMLAGAHGIDLVLFTVAADDGVMPQTEEHLDIVHLLGVTRAIFVITKADLATPERIRAVAEEIAIVTAGSALAGSPAVAVSSVTGQGLDELRTRIASALGQVDRPAPRGDFRLPVDRAFVLQGHGLVVTGTSQSGTVRAGDQVRGLPGSQVFRVRSVQVHGKPVEAAAPGQRVALNLTGTETSSIARGHVICHADLDRVSDRFDARLELPPTNPRPIRNHQRVRVHVGTAERLGKLTLLGVTGAAPGPAPLYCQITLDEPLQIMRGDHFVLRDASARWTLAGGVVTHPWAEAHRRRDPALAGRLAALAGSDPAAAVRAFADASTVFATPVRDVRHFLNTDDASATALLSGASDLRLMAIEDERLYTTSHKWQRLEAAIRSLLGPFHAAHPLVPGMEMEELRSRLPFEVPPRVFRAAVDELSASGVVARDASLVRLPGHVVRLDDPEQGLADGIIRLVTDTPLAPPELSQIEKTLGVARQKLLDVVRVLERERAIVRVAADLYFSRGAIEQLKADVRAHFAPTGQVTPGAFRDRFGTSRKYAIPLLEFLDREGVTIRTGDVRRLAKTPVAPASR